MVVRMKVALSRVALNSRDFFLPFSVPFHFSLLLFLVAGAESFAVTLHEFPFLQFIWATFSILTFRNQVRTRLSNNFPCYSV